MIIDLKWCYLLPMLIAGVHIVYRGIKGDDISFWDVLCIYTPVLNITYVFILISYFLLDKVSLWLVNLYIKKKFDKS